jgi:hypothetical protein
MDAERALLQVCAGTTPERLAAWPHWVAALGTPREGAEPYPAHWRDLLPLVAFRQREHALGGPDWLLSRLRTATLLEERRLVAVEDTAAEILGDPAIAEHDPMMLGGLGLGQTVYPHPATRHTGIITLLLRPGTKLRPLMYALVAQGYRTRQGGWRTLHLPLVRHARLRLAHPSQMKLLLLSAPAWRMSDPLGHTGLKTRAVPMMAGNARFTSPSLSDSLALTAHRFTGESRNSLIPAVDEALLRQYLDGPAPVGTAALIEE